jgi:hypothetical protein
LQKHGISANRSGAIKCSALHGIFLFLYCYQLALKGCTLSGASTIGARQCAAHHKQFAALYQFPSTLPIIWAQVAEKRFLEIWDVVLLK